MRHRYPLIPLTLCLMALLCSSAAAQRSPYPDDGPLTGREWSMVRLAVQFWADRGVRGCPDGVGAQTAKRLRAPDGRWAEGLAVPCHIWFDREPDPGYRPVLVDTCELIVHEVGHALGLPHSESGVMMADPGAWSAIPPSEPPHECHVWARQQAGKRARGRK